MLGAVEVGMIFGNFRGDSCRLLKSRKWPALQSITSQVTPRQSPSPAPCAGISCQHIVGFKLQESNLTCSNDFANVVAVSMKLQESNLTCSNDFANVVAVSMNWTGQFCTMTCVIVQSCPVRTSKSREQTH